MTDFNDIWEMLVEQAQKQDTVETFSLGNRTPNVNDVRYE